MNGTHLLVIDPQNDFIDTPGKPGSLAVPGAYDDMGRLAMFINRMGNRLYDIHVTMDTHNVLDVAHPRAFINSSGDNPKPFTMIDPGDLGKVWFGLTDDMTRRFHAYSEQLKAKGRYPHIIWPEHCLIGSWGHNVDERVLTELQRWEILAIGQVDYVVKGTNPWTEHYSAVQAEIPDPQDPGTQVNVPFVRLLQESDIVVLCGEALSHCLANTVRDLYGQFNNLFNPSGTGKRAELVLLRDCTSNVPGFEQLGEDFIKDFKSWGGKVVNSTDFGT